MRHMSLIALTFLPLCACTMGSPNFGDATRNNMAVEAVNPTPDLNVPIAMDGARATVGQVRYETDKVEKPVLYGTTSQGMGGTNGNGGASSEAGTSTGGM